MPQAKGVTFLLGELGRWRDAGLIDDATHARIARLYAPVPEDAFDAELEHAAALHAQVEAQARAVAEHEREAARAAAVPPPERTADPAAALAASARDVAAFHVAAPRAVDPVATALERESRWNRHVRPFLYDNALWIAALLLIVFGSLYFLRLVWNDLDSVLLHAAIAGALHAYAALFFGVGYLLCRRRDAHGAGRTLFAFAMALLPLGSVAAGELAATLAPHPVLATLVVGGALGAQGAMIAVMAGLYERAAIAPLVEASAGIALATMIAPLAPAYGAPAALGWVAIATGVAFIARGVLAGAARVNLRMSVILGGASLTWALAVLVARVAWTLDVPATSYAPVAAALGAVLVVADHRLRIRAGGAPRLTAIGLALHALVLLALGAALAGLAHQGYFDLGARIGVLACAAIATWTFARAARLHGRAAMTWLAAGSGLFAYFFLPAPFIGAMRLAERWAAGALGYADQPLPAAYYGLVFAPYLGLVLALAWRRADLRRDAARFVLVVGAIATALAATSTNDLRPLLFTWPFYAVGAVVVGRVLQRAYPAHAAQLLLAVSALALGAHFHDARVALAALALHAALGLAVPWLSGTVLAATTALVLGIATFPAWAPALAALALIAAAWRARGAAVAALATLAIAAAVASIAHVLAPDSVAPSLAVVACAALALSAYRQRAPKSRAVRGASLAVAVAGFAGALVQAAPGQTLASWWGLAAFGGAALYAGVALAVYRRSDPGRVAWIQALLALGALAAAAFAVEAWVAAPLQARAWVHVAALALASLAWARWSRPIAVTLAIFAAVPPFVAALALVVGLEIGDARFALGAALLALAALRVARRSADGRRLALLVALALPVVACAAAGLHAFALPLSALAVGLALYAALAGAPGLAWPIGVAAAAMIASHAHVDRPQLAVATVSLAIVLATHRRRAAASIAALVAVELGVLWIAIATSTGRYPPESVLALLGAALLASAALVRDARVRRAAFVVAIGEALGAAAALPPLAVATLGAALLLLVRERREWTLLVAVVVLPITWAVARWQLWPAPGPALDVAATLIAAHAAFWIGRATRRSVFTRPLATMAQQYPVLLLPLVPRLGPAGTTLALALAAVHYAAMAELTGNKHGRVPAALAANGTIASAFMGVHVVDPLAYGVPVALSLLFLVHTYADELGPAGRGALRTLVLLAIYGVAVGTALVRADVTRSLVLVPLLCVAGMLAGTALRVRAYLALGMAFLVGDLVLNLVRYGLESRPLGALFLTALGLALVAAMVAFSLERERILRRYSLILGELRTWD